MAATIRQELEEEFLSTIRKGQETALEAAKPLAEAVHYVIPAMPAVRVPLAGLLPTAREAVAGGYEFAGHLLANQRQFAGEVITATSPLRPGRAGQRRGPQPPGPPLRQREATPAGRAATRQRRNPQFPALPRSVVRDEGDGP
jgi:hypothetical protein